VTTVLAAVVLVAVLTCPAHMLWRVRRGRSASCVPGLGAADEVRRRQARLAEQVARVGAERG
jgi:hypothetical protein